MERFGVGLIAVDLGGSIAPSFSAWEMGFGVVTAGFSLLGVLPRIHLGLLILSGVTFSGHPI